MSYVSDSFNDFFAIVLSDTVNAPFPFDALYVGSAGAVVVIKNDNLATAVTFTAVPAGTVLKVAGIRVNSTSTTAANLVGLRRV